MDIVSIVDHALCEKVLRLEACICAVFERMDTNCSGAATTNELATFLGDLSEDNRKDRKHRAGQIIDANHTIQYQMSEGKTNHGGKFGYRPAATGAHDECRRPTLGSGPN